MGKRSRRKTRLYNDTKCFIKLYAFRQGMSNRRTRSKLCELNDSLASVHRLSLFPVLCDKRLDFSKVNIPTTRRCDKLKVAIFMVALYQRFNIVFIKKFNEFSLENLLISSNLVKCKPDVCIDCHECWKLSEQSNILF